jgi:transposase
MEGVVFNQVVHRGCGIDVHKKLVVATICGEGLSKETRTFSTFTRSLTELKEWLLSQGVTHVAMESTGVYWKPVYHVLEPSGLKVWIVNARHIKYVPGHKTDKQDSAWLCKLLLAGLLKPSYIPAKQQRELRDLTRYRTKLIQQVASEKNRIIRVLEDCNIKLSSVLSDTGGAVATKLLSLLCEGKQVTMADIESVWHRRLQASKEDVYEACQGLVEAHHVFLLQSIKRDIANTEVLIATLNERIKTMLGQYDNVLELLREVPGLNTKTVEDLVAEIGLDMSVFPTEKHLASWAGMCPGNNESAGKKKSGRTNHGNKQVKAVLTEAAWAATHTKGTFYSARYHRLAARRGKKRALIAIGHSILKTAYHILQQSVSYKELGADYLNELQEKKRKHYLQKELEKMGYNVNLVAIVPPPIAA